MQTHPYRWPFDHDPMTDLTAARMAVVVCGWQQYWLSTLDRTVDVDAAVADIRVVIDQLRSLGVGVMWVRNGAPRADRRSGRRPSLPVVSTTSWQLLAGRHPGDLVIDSPGLDAFMSGWIDRELTGARRDRLIMCGLGTEGTISSTNRSANDRGFECLTATDAIVHHDRVTGAAMLSSIGMSGGIFGATGRAADLICTLRDVHGPGEPSL